MKKILVVCIVLLFAACNINEPVFKSDVSIPDANWNRFNTYYVTYNVIDTSQTYDVNFQINIDSSFYENFFFYYVNMHTPDKALRYIERRIQFKDSANNYINSVEKDSLVFNQIIFSQVKFTVLGKHVFEIGNLMSKFDNRGVQRIGITINKVKNK